MNYQWLDRNEYPFESIYYEVQGHRLHYIDVGSGSIVLFVHGTPSWSFDFRHLIKSLQSHYRCVAIDHIGFGLSDKPKNYDYSTQNHSETLRRFILDKNLTDIHLVVHDFGGPIGLNFATQYPERIKSVTVMNSWLWNCEHESEYKQLAKVVRSPLTSFLYLNLNFSPKVLLPKSMTIKPSKEILRQYVAPFPNKSSRYGLLAFAKSLVNDQDWFEGFWNKLSSISNKPALLIWGMEDSFIKPHYLKKFETAFKSTRSIPLYDCGHFPQEEYPELVAEQLESFIKDL